MVQIIDLQLSKILDPADIFGNNESNIGRCMKMIGKSDIYTNLFLLVQQPVDKYMKVILVRAQN
jgi:hypothetical protein